jgi:G:T-mismatch repair DNA endonuclease (very short patch repair protein)
MNKEQKENLRRRYRFMTATTPIETNAKRKTKIVVGRGLLVDGYKLGTTMGSWCLGYEGHGSLLTWDACPICGKARWVRYHVIGHPCKGCSNAINNKKPESNKKKSEAMKGYREFRFHKGKKRGTRKGHVNSPAHREKNRQSMLRQWRDPVERAKLIKRFTDLKPNRKESALDVILQKYFPSEWRYTGNFDVAIGTKCPDWTNCNGRKAVILFHGLYWHLYKFQKKNPELTREQVEVSDINHYKEYGFSCLIIWEDELKDEIGLVNKINQFVRIEEAQ